MRLDRRGKAEPVAAVLPLLDHLGNEPLADLEPGAGPGPPPRLDQGVPLALSQGLDEQDLHLSAAGAPAVEPRRDHPRVVEHQEISWTEETRQVTDPGVAVRPGAVEHQQAALAAGGRLLGDAGGR